MPYDKEKKPVLTKAELEALREEYYCIVTPEDKAEFIHGEIVYERCPVLSRHNVIVSSLSQMLTLFADKMDCGYVGIEKVAVHLENCTFEPDVCFFNLDKKALIHSLMYRFPPPDLVVEVLSDETRKRDKTIKFTEYELNGVTEYWIIEPANRKGQIELSQYVLQEGKYLLHQFITEKGMIESVAVPGFNIPIEALTDVNIRQEELFRDIRKEAKNQGIEIGKELGKVQGIEIGKELEKLTIAKKLLLKGLSREEVAQLTEIPLDKLSEII